MAILTDRMRTRRRNGLWGALLASAALHVLVLAWLATRSPSPTPAVLAAEPPIAIQVIELPPAPAVPPTSPPRRAVRRGTAPEGSAETSPRAVASAPAPAPAPAPGSTPGEGAGPASSPDAPRSISLMPSERALEEIAGGTGGPVVLDGSEDGVPVPSSERYGWAGPGSGVHAPRIPKDVVGEAAAEAVGKRRAELGVVDPYFREVARALEGGWTADRRDPPPQSLAEAVRDFGKAVERFKDVWLEGADRFGKTGNPLPEGVGQAFDHGLLASGSDQMKAMVGYQTLMSAGFTSVRRAVLRVVQDETGKIVLVELVEPSRDRDMDRQALMDVRAAAERLPPPPAALLGRKSQLSSFWTFEIKLRVIPPSTGIAFEFDEKGIQPLVPFGHQVKKSVRLLYFN